MLRLFVDRSFGKLVIAGALRRAGAQTDGPNIVFILADDLGFADVSCYGQRDYTTPNVDRLALEGMKFTQAYANSAVCSATRTALIYSLEPVVAWFTSFWMTGETLSRRAAAGAVLILAGILLVELKRVHSTVHLSK